MTKRLARSLLAAGLLTVSMVALAQTPQTGAPMSKPLPPVAASLGKAGEETIPTFKYNEGPIDGILSALETYTGRSIIRPGQLPTATYTLVIDRPIPKVELVTALETLLAMNQVAVTPMGEHFLKVVALAQAKNETPELITGSALALPPSGRIATKVFELNFLRVTEFVPQIQTMLSPGIGGGVVSLEKSNVVMVTDSVANLQRIEQLLAEVDGPREGSLTPKFYGPLQYAKASDVVTKIRAMLTGPAQNQLRATTTYNADDNTNQVIVIADPREYPLFDALINKLDTKSAPNTRNEVIYLKHAVSKDVATLLNTIISGQVAAAQKAQQVSRQGGANGNPTTPGAPGAPVSPAGIVPPVNALAAAVATAEANSQFSSLITVASDDRTNSIVVSGTIDDVHLIHDIIDKVDVLLAQVSIQVVIAEVTLSDTDLSGVNALSLTVGQRADGKTSITQFSANNTNGSAGGIGGWNITGGVVNPLGFTAALESEGSHNLVKILQTSTILTTHSKQGEIVVTTQQPVITSTTAAPSTSTTSGFDTNSSVAYKDIGLTLKVTPLIGDDGSIQLTIDQTVDNNEGSTTVNGNAQPIIGHREATATVNVMDGQMVVLGGLQSTSHALDRQKIGFIYEIPIISNLLGGRNNDLEKSELLLFIRPHVLKPEENSVEAQKSIDGMSNHEQINGYLKDPYKAPPDSATLLDRLK